MPGKKAPTLPKVKNNGAAGAATVQGPRVDVIKQGEVEPTTNAKQQDKKVTDAWPKSSRSDADGWKDHTSDTWKKSQWNSASPCRQFVKNGACKFGSRCKFVHPVRNECYAYAQGRCAKGDKCAYEHSSVEKTERRVKTESRGEWQAVSTDVMSTATAENAMAWKKKFADKMAEKMRRMLEKVLEEDL
jgi:hypothetical protein